MQQLVSQLGCELLEMVLGSSLNTSMMPRQDGAHFGCFPRDPWPTHSSTGLGASALLTLELQCCPPLLPFLMDARKLATPEWEGQGSPGQGRTWPVERLGWALWTSWCVYGCFTLSSLNFPPHSSIPDCPGSLGHC